MHNILIFITTLLLISCLEESDKSNNRAELIKDESHKAENNDRLTDKNIIINPQDNNTTTTNTKGPLNITKNPITNQFTNTSDTKLEQVAYKPTFNVNSSDIVLGDVKSSVVVVEYFSPTCLHCAYYHDNILPEVKKKYIDTNKIAYIIREFIGNRQDLDAAILGRCQNDTDSFFKFQAVILAQQDKWGNSDKYRELLINIAQIGGVSSETYSKCLSDNKIVEILLANTNLAASSRGFVGTPSFFINGVLINSYNLASLSKKIDQILENNSIKSKN